MTKTPLRKMKEYDLVSLRSFVAVVETGSFYNASVQMETSSASISRRVSSLENALGVHLLNRTTRQLELTTAGQQFFQDIKEILESFEQAEERLSSIQETLSGVIRIAAPMTFGIRKLSPLLPAFMNKYPQIMIQLQLEDRISDLVGEGLDLSLRIGELQDSTLVSMRITELPRLYCASPEYLKKYGTPQAPSDLKGHRCLRYSYLTARSEWGITEGGELPDMHFPLFAGNGEVLREAAIQGIGITMLPWFIVENAIHAGILVPVLQPYAPPPLPLSIVRPTRRYTPLRVTTLMEWLRGALFTTGNYKPPGKPGGL
ncbi:LysR family transcriptional regulator [Trabulsiella odontotermitis]|uniref:LysR family transcriptional regulator n=1 Tax=Trabulsiella odontotermitis TaxID=379893 RepID=UPI003AD54FF0